MLGAAFGWAVPMAFAAQTGGTPELAWLVFGVALVWAVIYDTFYAMVDREDDRRIGVKSTAILFGDVDLFVIAGLQLLMLALLWWVGELAGRGARVAVLDLAEEAARKVAEEEAQKVQVINEFLTDMLASVQPEKALGREVTVREVLAEAAERLEDDAIFDSAPPSPPEMIAPACPIRRPGGAVPSALTSLRLT